MTTSLDRQFRLSRRLTEHGRLLRTGNGGHRFAELRTADGQGTEVNPRRLAVSTRSRRALDAVLGKPGACREGRLSGSMANSHCRPSAADRSLRSKAAFHLCSPPETEADHDEPIRPEAADEAYALPHRVRHWVTRQV